MASALLIVDTQPTFCEGGGLAVAGGNDCAERIAAFVRSSASSYDVLVASEDWHIDPGSHWATSGIEPADGEMAWPVHGRAGTAEADLHPALARALAEVAGLDVVLVRKGMRAAAYSAFEGVVTADPSVLEPKGDLLGAELARRNVDAVDLVGIATDHCVRASALDAAGLGLHTRVLVDLCVGVDRETTTAALSELAAAGVEVVAGTAGREVD